MRNDETGGKMSNEKKRGIVYLAFGYEYLLMAAHSARTARASNPGITCELITNVRYDNDKIPVNYRFDRIRLLAHRAEENRYVKTNIVQYTDLEYGVYIDCDTEVWGSLDPVFGCLDNFDLALKHCSKPTRKDYEVAPGLPSCLFPEWNGGVIFFRNNDRTKQLFDEWSEIYRAEGKNRDQPALARAIFHSKWGGRLLSLNALWNTSRQDVRLFQNGISDSRIWHYRKAEEWPAVAPSVCAANEIFHETVLSANPSMEREMKEVDRRYRFLSSRAYRFSCCHPRLRRNFVRSVELLMNARLMARFKLDRNHQVSGKGYERIGSGVAS